MIVCPIQKIILGRADTHHVSYLRAVPCSAVAETDRADWRCRVQKIVFHAQASAVGHKKNKVILPAADGHIIAVQAIGELQCISSAHCCFRVENRIPAIAKAIAIGIVPAPASQIIAVCTTGQGVIPFAAIKPVCACSTGERVVTGTAIQGVIAITAAEQVIAVIPFKQVVADTALKNIVPFLAEKRVIAAKPVHGVVA